MTNISQFLQFDKPPTTPSMRQKRERAIAATIELLAELYPKCFSIYEERRRPLKNGIHQDILATLDGIITPTELHQALRYYCSNLSYLSRTRTDAWRIDLNGEPAGTVTADEEAHTRARLVGIRAKQVARTAAKTALVRSEQKKEAQASPAKRLSLADLKAAALARKPGINMESDGRK
jgi:ProP effector